MVYRRATKKKVYKRKTYRKRRPNNYSSKRITYISRTVEKTSFQLLGSAWYSQVYSFRLDDLVQYTEFTTLFDQYKIEKVKLTYFPRYSETNAPTVVTNAALFTTNTLLWNAVSDDGTTLLSTQANALQRMNAKMRIANKPFTVWVKKPKYQIEVATTLAIASARPSTGFLDCDNYGVVHWGHEIAGYSPAANPAQLVEWKCYATYYLALKDVR